MIYTIKNEHSTAKVQSLGGELISLVHNGREYIWTGDEKYWNGHNPNLFPVIGFLKDNRTCFDGKEYTIPKHGYARKTEFSLISCSQESITLEMTDNEQTREGFPFRFSLQITHALTEDGFETTYRIENRSAQVMHFMIGGHTGFVLPFSEGDAFDDHTLIFETTEPSVTRYTAVNGQLIEDPNGVSDYMDGSDRIALRYDLFDDDALMLAGLRSRKVALLNREGKGVGMEFAGFDALGIWTPTCKNAPFLCIEPWNGINAFVNEEAEFSKKPYIRSAPSGGCYSVSYRVRIFD